MSDNAVMNAPRSVLRALTLLLAACLVLPPTVAPAQVWVPAGGAGCGGCACSAMDPAGAPAPLVEQAPVRCGCCCERAPQGGGSPEPLAVEGGTPALVDLSAARHGAPLAVRATVVRAVAVTAPGPRRAVRDLLGIRLL